MDALLTNIKLIPNYEKVKILMIIDGCNIKLIPNYEKVKILIHGCTVEQCESFDYLQVNGEGCEGFGAFYKSKLA